MEKQICNDYNENFLTIAELSKKYNKSTDTIRNILKNNSIHIRSNNENAILKRTNYLFSLNEIEKEVIREYRDNKSGLIKSGKKFNLTINNVKYILNKNNIKIRNFSEATKESNTNRSYYKNDNFFSIESSDMAWVLGFLAADGSVRKNSNEIKITLAIKDEEILLKIKELLKIENPIHYYTTNKGFDIAELKWSSKQHKQDLKKYSIIPQKTFKLIPPYELNKKYWIDYIRGYFDGDGSINLIKNSNNRGAGSLRWQVCSATKEILEWIIDYFYEEFNIPKVNINCDNTRKSPLYYFQYSSVATRKIYNFLYTDSNMFLKRKKEKFEEILAIVKSLYE